MITLNVNGQSRQIDADPEMPLLWALRDLLKLTGTKYGCGVAACGACTVHVDGQVEEPHVEEGAEFAVLEGSTVSLPGFLERLIGLERGGPHTIEFDLPTNGSAAQHKTALVNIIEEAKQIRAPTRVPEAYDFASLHLSTL